LVAEVDPQSDTDAAAYDKGKGKALGVLTDDDRTQPEDEDAAVAQAIENSKQSYRIDDANSIALESSLCKSKQPFNNASAGPSE
jgi:hypothetical protein